METLCYNQIGKFCYLFQQKLLTEYDIKKLSPVIIMLADPILLELMNKIVNSDITFEPVNFKFILLSGQKNLIDDWIKQYQYFPNQNLTISALKELLLTDDLDLIKKFKIDSNKLIELIDWASESDLLEVSAYLKSICNDF